MSTYGTSWVKTDVTELMALIGLLYHLDTMKQNLVSVDKIWPGIACDSVAKATMTKKRFVALCNALRFDDNTTRTARRAKDMFCPIRDIFDSVKRKLSQYFIPGMNMTFDEQLIPWRGRVNFLQ
ncbi:PiggyBac transposable element-derived protein 1-like [Plakobranchus ocellatus]|uniref:PiggyBac transposable element-derived protein 1-like n=1 Tax=Plakobranchus ocellatus TaxID=259542 RepID=A0AAV4CVX2_9GAST|nr:PiggyBac transposable element-derived protein 1-like [Plakobranchus ocellatus]